MKRTKARRRKPATTQPVTGGLAAFSGLYVPVERLAFYAKNARIHNAAQVEVIAGSIRRFGFANPVLADASGIVAGHGRVLAAMKLYEDGETLKLPSGEAVPVGMVPVVDVSGWTVDERRAYILADNQIALMSDYDADILKDELAYLSSIDSGLLASAGFDEITVSDVMADDAAWSSDITVVERAGSHVEAIPAKIVISCRPEDAEQVRKAVKRAVDRLQLPDLALS